MDKFDRVKRREYMRKYYAKHRDEWNAYQREWYDKNRVKNKEQRRIVEREKLVELLQDGNNPVWGWFPNNATMVQLADYLMANGVSVKV